MAYFWAKLLFSSKLLFNYIEIIAKLGNTFEWFTPRFVWRIFFFSGNYRFCIATSAMINIYWKYENATQNIQPAKWKHGINGFYLVVMPSFIFISIPFSHLFHSTAALNSKMMNAYFIYVYICTHTIFIMLHNKRES